MVDMSLRELLDVVTSYYPNPLTPAEVIEITRTDDIAGRQYMRLSGGQQRRVQYALAICGRPQLVFLDEPTAGLDVESREMQWDTIRALLARRTAIVLTTHYLEEAEELADRVIMLAEGRVIAHGTVDEMCALVPRKTLSCHTSIGLERIASWPEVGEATIDRKGLLTLVVSDAEAVARQLLAADSGLRDLEVRPAGLQDAFKALTNGSRR